MQKTKPSKSDVYWFGVALGAPAIILFVVMNLYLIFGKGLNLWTALGFAFTSFIYAMIGSYLVLLALSIREVVRHKNL